MIHLLLSICMFAPAPAPVVKKFRPVLYEDMKSVHSLVWLGKTYPIAFSVDDGVYRCENHVGTSVCWTGTWELAAGGVVSIKEQMWTCSDLGEWGAHGDSYGVEIKLHWKDGKLVGEGWNEPIQLIHTIRR
jgi:hypothetical protein